MKNGMMILAAVVALGLLLSPAYAAQDTKVINSAITTSGPGADILVGSDGLLYSSFGQGNTVEVYKGSPGDRLTTQKYTVNTGDTIRLTAVGRTKQDSIVVAAYRGYIGNLGADSLVSLYYGSAGSSLTNLGAVTVYGPSGAQDTIGKSGPNVAGLQVTSLDIATNDSFIVVASTVDGGVHMGETNLLTWINIWRYDTTPGTPVQAGTPFNLQAITDSDVCDSGAADGIQIAFDPCESLHTGTMVLWIGKTVKYPNMATTTADTVGYFLHKMYMPITAPSSPTQINTVFNALGDSRVIGRFQLDNVTGADTRARVTLAIVNDTNNSGQILVREIGDSRAHYPQQLSTNIGSRAGTGTGGHDTIVYVDLDTGISPLSNSNMIGSFTFGRTGGTYGFVVGLVGSNLLERFDTVIAITQAPVGSSAFTFDTATIVANGNRTTRRFESAYNGATLYTVGYDAGPTLLYYISLITSESTKKKDSGVCLMDRLFGQTSLRAAFPAMKSFRDTLLGTDMGRKLVSLYYSF